MRLLSHLNIKKYPFYVPQSFYDAFSVESVTLDFDPFSFEVGKNSVPLQDMKSAVVYSLNRPLPKTFTLKSYHSNMVVKATESSPEADAQYVISSFSNLFSILQEKQHMGIQTADCLAVVFCFENEEHFIGAVSHAGWRGYSAGILQNTIEKLQQEAALLGITSEIFISSLKIHIAPAIFGVSYECGEEIRETLFQHGKRLFSNYPEMSYFSALYANLIDVRQDEDLSCVVDQHLLQNQQSYYIPGKIFPDLQLLAALECFIFGIQQENIEILRENTYSHPTLFSFRGATHRKSNHSLRQWTHLRFPLLSFMEPC